MRMFWDGHFSISLRWGPIHPSIYPSSSPSNCTLWYGLTDVGDGRRSGFVMGPNHHTTCRSFKHQRVSRSRSNDDDDEEERDADTMSLSAQDKYRPPDPRKTSRKLTRLQAVQQLFFAYINRTEAYDHAHRIALVLFGDEVRTACGFTPLFSQFRDSVDRARTGGDTRLFDALAEATTQLAAFQQRHPDCERLRIFVMSDGGDTKSDALPSAVARDIRRAGIVVDAVTIGNEEELALRGIVHATGGYTFR